MKFVLILLFTVPLAVIYANEQATKYFNEGNKLYEESRFDEAVKSYEIAINEGIQNPDLFYNYAKEFRILARLTSFFVMPPAS